jgi:hemoglobin
MIPNSTNHNLQENTLYQLIGGETGTRKLAAAFYDEMENNVHLQELLAIHKQPLDNIRLKFFEFLSGWLGGPGLFEQKYGHPQLRARHLPFKVTKKQRDLWMLCMNNAMRKVINDSEIEQHLKQAFAQMASHMINC